MSTKEASLLIGERIGGYCVTRELARGGMGVVYEAIHDKLGQRAAVKVLSEDLASDPKYQEYVDRFFDEARAISIIQHTGIVKIHDVGTLPSGIVYILMEFLDGEPLWDRLCRYLEETGRGVPLAEAMRITRQLASAIGEAHKKSILHRDLKPANVIIIADAEAPGGERTKLIDFGIARFLDSPHRRTALGMTLGTPTYMSPEQCQGYDVDAKSDVYALGVVLYEMLVGQPPFDGELATVAIMHAMKEPPAVRDLVTGLPETIHQLIHSMLAKKPADRPTMAEVVMRVQQWESEQGTRSGAHKEIDDATQVMQGGDMPVPQASTSPRVRPEAQATVVTGAGGRPPMDVPTLVSQSPRPLVAAVVGAGIMLLLMLVLIFSRR